jgi:hypothetical protein
MFDNMNARFKFNVNERFENRDRDNNVDNRNEDEDFKPFLIKKNM